MRKRVEDRHLSEEQYYVARQRGTERAFSGEHLDNKLPGTYHCVVCGKHLFNSSSKYDSGSGWPSFWDEASVGAVKRNIDTSHGMTRVEVTCSNCEAHLGHLFEDGPQPTGMRFCINSVVLDFKKTQGE